MIFGGPTMYESRHKHKLTTREFNAVTFIAEASPTYLKLLEVVITINRANHPNYVP
jgi:hypothetical protein